MSKITEIENAIVQLGPAEFQKFCDTFLRKLGEYGAVLGLGMKSGTSKTTTGNPDTYFRKENGKYVFVAYTAQQNSIYEKLREDIDKCLDYSKTGIHVKDIERIICCHTSSNLLAGDDKKLHDFCEEQGIILKIYGVDEIAQLIYHKYPILARDFLNIPVDTNQIMTPEDFIDLYDSNDMAAPLNTVFLHRKDELRELKKSINDNSVVIVHGSAGVGKTKIVLEVTKQFSVDNNYRLLCVKNNNLELYEDLISYTGEMGKYLFFVDDANELIGLPHIMQYIAKKNDGYEFKLILTVRDYVKEPVFRTVQQYASPFLFELGPLKDEEIKLLLDVNMEIRNEDYVSQIVRISEGNPRIAYMAGKLAKDTQSLNAIHDVTQVYEQYYASVIQIKLGDERRLCLTMGILAMVRAVIMDKMDSLEEIFNSIGITKEEFMDDIQRLSSMELVEVHLDKIAALSDQCLANYMLYYAFFEKKLLPFSTVLKVGFKYFRDGLIQSMDTLLNLFLNDSLQQYIRIEVKKVWTHFQNSNDSCYFDFVKVFHTFQPEDAFLMAAEKIHNIKQQPFVSHYVDFDKSTVGPADDVLGLMTGYGKNNYMNTVVDLLMSFVEKSEENAVRGYSWLKSNYDINRESYRYDFYTEKTIQKTLTKYLDSNELCQRFILKHISHMLAYEFKAIDAKRGNCVVFYDVQILLSDGVKEYRKACWDNLVYLIKYTYLKDDIYNILSKYAASIPRGKCEEVVGYDYTFIKNIISTIQYSTFKMALLIRDLQYGYKRFSLSCPDTNAVLNSEEWRLFKLLENNVIQSDLPYEEYEKVRKEQLIEYAKSLLASDISKFVKKTNRMIEEIADQDDMMIRAIDDGVQQILNTVSTNTVLAKISLASLMDFGQNININPCIILQILLKNGDEHDVWYLIDSRHYYLKNSFEFIFFEQIPPHKVTGEVYKNLLRYFKDDSDKDLKSLPYRNLRLIDKFIKYDEDAYVTVSKIIFDKRRYSTFIVNVYFNLLFHSDVYKPLEIIKLFKSDLNFLKSIYFFMIENDDFYDYKGYFLLEFLKIDDSWVDAYADLLLNNIKNKRCFDREKYKALWLSDDFIKYYDKVFYKISEEADRFSMWRLGDAFSAILSHGEHDDVVKKRQKYWVLHIVRQYSHDERIIMLFEALSEVTTDIRRMAMIEFLKNNDSYEMFEKIPLDSSHWGGTESDIIPNLQRKIDYLESLLRIDLGIKYLRHTKRIKDKIDIWKAHIKAEEQQIIYRKLYR